MRWLTKVLEFVGKVGLLGLRVLTDSIRPPFEFAQLLHHLAEVGNKSLALIVVSGFALGAVMTLHTRSTLVTSIEYRRSGDCHPPVAAPARRQEKRGAFAARV